MKKDVTDTRDFYNKFGKEYHKNRSDPKKNFYVDYLEKPTWNKLLKNNIRNKKVLDLGCGSGIFTKTLLKHGGKVIGIDLSKELIEIAKKEIPKTEFYVGDMQKLPFKSGKFDIVASNLVLHYLKNWNFVFKEVSRVLKKKGIFLFYTNHPFVGAVSKKIIGGKTKFILNGYFNDHKRVYWDMLPGEKIHLYRHTFEEISSSLYKSGFVIEQIIEPKPPKSSMKADKKDYTKANNHPVGLAIKARKIK